MPADAPELTAANSVVPVLPVAMPEFGAGELFPDISAEDGSEVTAEGVYAADDGWVWEYEEWEFVWVPGWADAGDDSGVWALDEITTEPPVPEDTDPTQVLLSEFTLADLTVSDPDWEGAWNQLEREWAMWFGESSTTPEASLSAINSELPVSGEGMRQPPGDQVPSADESPSERQARLEREVFELYPDLAEKANALFASDRAKWEELKGRLVSAFNPNAGDDENRSNMRQVLEGEFPQPQPDIRDEAPMPRERTGTIDNLKKWEKEISDYLTASADAKLKAIAAAQAQLPKDAANRDYWIRYYEHRSVAGSGQDFDVTKEQAAVNAEYARMLKDRANFVVGADGKPVAITDAGKLQIAAVAAMIKQFEEYRNKSPIDKLAEALKYARDNGLISGELGRRVDEFLKPENLALFGTFTAVGVFAGGSFAPFVGALGFALLGKSAVDITHDLALGMGIALGATGPNDIRTAAVYLSRGLGGITELGTVTAGGAAAGRALGMGLGALRGKRVQQQPNGQVEVVEPTWRQTPLDRLATATDNPNVQRMSAPGEAPKPPGEITPAPAKSTDGASTSGTVSKQPTITTPGKLNPEDLAANLKGITDPTAKRLAISEYLEVLKAQRVAAGKTFDYTVGFTKDGGVVFYGSARGAATPVGVGGVVNRNVILLTRDGKVYQMTLEGLSPINMTGRHPIVDADLSKGRAVELPH